MDLISNRRLIPEIDTLRASQKPMQVNIYN